MSDQLLDLLKFALLALLYLFFARVLWAVWSEVRTPTAQRVGRSSTGAPTRDATTPGATRAPAATTPGKRRRGEPTRLTVLEPKARKGQQFGLGGEVTIGRAAGCTIALVDDTYASQLHARVFVSDHDAWVDDLGSTNGTYLNGNRVTQPTRVRSGDRIQVGGTVLEAG